MSEPRLRSLRTTDVVELCEFCRKLPGAQTTKEDFFVRFAIGLYQIPGFFHWKDELNRYESLASAAIHFNVVIETLADGTAPGLECANWLHAYGRYFTVWPTRALDPKSLLVNIGAAQQMVFYRKQAGKTQRSTRYKFEALTNPLLQVIFDLICAIPSRHRSTAFENASAIMLGKL